MYNCKLTGASSATHLQELCRKSGWEGDAHSLPRWRSWLGPRDPNLAARHVLLMLGVLLHHHWPLHHLHGDVEGSGHTLLTGLHSNQTPLKRLERDQTLMGQLDGINDIFPSHLTSEACRPRGAAHGLLRRLVQKVEALDQAEAADLVDITEQEPGRSCDARHIWEAPNGGQRCHLRHAR